MAGYFSPDEQNTFYNSQPTKTIGAAALLFNEANELLIVKPSYKAGWAVVGGICDKDESLLAAVIRETHEEVGLLLREDDFSFAGMRYVKPRNGRNEDMQAYFKATLTPAQCQAILLAKDELSDFVFVSGRTIGGYADAARIQAVTSVLPQIIQGVPFYIENEKRMA